MLYGPSGKPLKHDPRTPEQQEFDRKLRQQMGDNGGQFWPRNFIDQVKEKIVMRDEMKAAGLAKLPEDHSGMNRIVDEYDDRADFRRRNPTSK